MKALSVLFMLLVLQLSAQHKSNIIATLDSQAQTLTIKHDLTLVNDSDTVWNEVYLVDWAHAFSSNDTPLADRFAEDFKNKFEFASDANKGRTTFTTATIDNNIFSISRLPSQQDIIRLVLKQPINPDTSQVIHLEYTIDIPEDDYTGYGRSTINDYNLRYWYVSPAVFNNGIWEYYSHKNLHDYYVAPHDIAVSLHVPSIYKVISNLTTVVNAAQTTRTSYLLEGKNITESRLHIVQDSSSFEKLVTPHITVITDIKDTDLSREYRLILLDRVGSFLQDKLGNYTQPDLLASTRYYKESPVIGLSSLPGFLNPFPAGFMYELQLLKSMTRNWVTTTNHSNKRAAKWLDEATVLYLMIQYNETYYPDLKISGKLGDIWGIRGFHAARLDFNEQYGLLYSNSARLNLDQAIDTSSDELVKYNEQIGTRYKAAVGLAYLNDYLGDDTLEKSLRTFYTNPQNQSVEQLRTILKRNTNKPIDWFFDDYITSHKRMDWKIKNIKKHNDSITVTIKNKSDRILPVALYLMNNDNIINKVWIPGFKNEKQITIACNNADRIELNSKNALIEFTLRDNYKTLKPFPSLNRPLEFRLFKDIEDPTRSQIFLMPDVTFNIYDGLSLGTRLYNGNLISKPFRYSIKPAYGTNSNKLVGSVSFSYAHPIDDRSQQLYEVRYGLNATTFSYANDLLYRRGLAFLSLNFRPKDLRSNQVQSLSFRNVLVSRDRNPSTVLDEPDYNVFNINYGHSNVNLKRFLSYGTGLEVSQFFTKLDARLQWRKLYKDNRQLSVRVFAGAFLSNDTQSTGDFFSFALDRPTDYLFDYNYYGRSESSGLFSQQLILAEGGFKSQLEPAFANQWITTVNTSYSLWKYVFAYGDVGFVKNKGTNPAFVYDSGIRLNLLQDYFELYFPVYSNNGWEIAQPDYDQKIRFIVSLDLSTFIKLFQRRWY